jgi:SAM-dependent methyltransferase
LAGKRRNRNFTANTADRHELYQLSVQSVSFEVDFFGKTFKRLRKRKALSLREDFCGTALLCREWILSDSKRTATGIDIDAEVLAWGRERNLEPIGEPGDQVTLLQQDVRDPVRERFDIINAMNFSYWVFKTRDELREYFCSVRRSLAKDGMFFLDLYGGWDTQETLEEKRSIKGKFKYIWELADFDPISHDIVHHIHFEFKDGTRMDKAFTYRWRYWSLPEIRELLAEAGFSQSHVYFDVSEGSMRARKRAENQPAWFAYIGTYG